MIEKLEAQIKELKNQISENIRNISKPPSSDEFQKLSPNSQRKKISLKADGQKAVALKSR